MRERERAGNISFKSHGIWSYGEGGGGGGGGVK